jgi:hypothetical protein
MFVQGSSNEQSRVEKVSVLVRSRLEVGTGAADLPTAFVFVVAAGADRR